MKWLKLHHGYIGMLLIFWCVLTYHGIAVVEEFNVYLWTTGLVLGVVLSIHDLVWHLKHGD